MYRRGKVLITPKCCAVAVWAKPSDNIKHDLELTTMIGGALTTSLLCTERRALSFLNTEVTPLKQKRHPKAYGGREVEKKFKLMPIFFKKLYKTELKRSPVALESSGPADPAWSRACPGLSDLQSPFGFGLGLTRRSLRLKFPPVRVAGEQEPI
ncbi:hypothetical protein AAFF_G00154820 [Aldrovandia affinis]|uniref:Uncharacterized protein n=1 Tax=Aldrovandia affinis TaxID=143900 RepID=A0AAD7SZX0_9TELE|nr:hypothetical protein AAFF_G00154820 [Aldrovandia affinis]